MSEASRSNDERPDEPGNIEGAPGEAEAGRARSTPAREAIVELGDRARAVVEELARHARERREAAAARASEPPAAPIPGRPVEDAVASLPQRLGEIRAYMGEVADVLEATIERLETVEHQLGDPDENVERQLADGIARCERVLMGIEHRVEVTGAGLRSETSVVHAAPVVAPGGARVLVLSRSSRRRAELCVTVERQGLEAVAAHDFPSALRAALRTSPPVALIDLEGTPAERVSVLEQWRDYQDRGSLPLAAAVGIDEEDGSRHGFEIVREEHGAAAMAAVLVRLVRGGAGLPAEAREISPGDRPGSSE